MHQMTENDASLLFADEVTSIPNISLLHIYDQSTAADGKVRFKDVLAHVESRLDKIPVLRQKLLRVPMDLDFPYWIDDQDFSVEYHVRHIALPKPGDWRQFCIQASRIHARQLDMGRPLWELYVIEGLDSFLDLPSGSFAVLLKIHSVVMDVAQGHEISTLLHDITPGPIKSDPQFPWFPEPPPSNHWLLSHTLLNSLLSPWRRTLPLKRLLPKARTFLNDLSAPADNLVMTRFNSVVSPYRVFETRRFATHEFDSVRKLVSGASLHDVVLAVCGGGLRRYLDLQGELPDRPLMATLSGRIGENQDEPSGGGFEMVSLSTEIEDPLQRLQLIHQRSLVTASTPVTGLWPELQSPRANCSITGVPGPDQALYLGGARMSYFSAILPIADGFGLAFAVTRYDGRIVISFTSCHEQLSDPEVFAQCLRDSFQEYLTMAKAAEAKKLKLRRKGHKETA